MYGVRKTTLYLPDDLKAAIERLAADSGSKEADLIREAIGRDLAQRRRPRPRVPLTGEALGDPTAAESVDERLTGFGQE